MIAGSAAWAEILTKSLMIGGRARLAELDALGIGASIVDVEGIAFNTTWNEYKEK